MSTMSTNLTKLVNDVFVKSIRKNILPDMILFGINIVLQKLDSKKKIDLDPSFLNKISIPDPISLEKKKIWIFSEAGSGSETLCTLNIVKILRLMF